MLEIVLIGIVFV